MNLKHIMLVDRILVEILSNRDPVWKISAMGSQTTSMYLKSKQEAVVVYRGEKGKFQSERVEI